MPCPTMTGLIGLVSADPKSTGDLNTRETIRTFLVRSYPAYRNRMNSVAAKENLLKQVVWFVLNVFSTRFFYQAANSFADVEIPKRLLVR